MSRADVARATNLAVPTVYRIINELVRQGLVVETLRRRGGLGKPPVDLAVNSKGAYAIGFNFDRDLLVGVLVDLTGNVLQRIEVELDHPGPEATFSLMEAATKTFTAHPEIDRARLLGVGVGIPGPLHLDPVPSMELFELPGWEGVSVLDELSRRLGLPVVLENNPIAAAIGEMWYGEGRNVSNFFFIFFGLYLGGCVVLNRQPNRGVGGFGGEFGSIPYARDAHYPDGVKRLGHHVSLAALYEKLAAGGTRVRSADALEVLYHQKDPVLLLWLGEAVNYLAPELLRLEYLLDPEAIVFGERLPAVLFSHLITRLEARMRELRVSYKPYGPALVRGWAGVDAAALGAAALPIYRALEPNPALVLGRSERRREEDKQGMLWVGASS